MDSKYKLSTDFPLDKIVFITSGSFTVPNQGFIEHKIPHGLPFVPLATGNWSTSATFEVAYEFGTGEIDTSTNFVFYKADPTLTSNADHIKIILGNYYSGASITVNYRVICFQPSNIPPVSIRRTNVNVDDFMLDTDQSQVMLLKKGFVDMPTVSSGTVTTTAFSHNLGYLPQTTIWIERFGEIENKYQAAPGLGSLDCVVTNNSINIVANGSIAARVHYRVYVNG